MTARLFRLDDFDSPRAAEPEPEAVLDFEAQITAARDEGYARGFTDGAARAAEAGGLQVERLQAGLAEALSDAQITVQTARATAEADLLDLVTAIAKSALSQAAAADFTVRVTQAIRDELSAAPHACLTIRLCPAEAESMAVVLPEGIAIVADTEIHPGAAIIATDTGLTKLDTAGVLLSIWQAITPQTNQEATYDQRNQA